MLKNIIWLALTSLYLGLPIVASSQGARQQEPSPTRVVSQTIPLDAGQSDLRTRSHEATRTAELARAKTAKTYPRRAVSSVAAGNWQPLAVVPGNVRRIKFITERVGYLSCEAGLVYKTVDGGASWQLILQTASTHHWYGLAAQGGTVMVVGFNNNINAVELGIMRVSRDFGATWSTEIPVSKTDWLMNIDFATRTRGIIATNPWSAQPDGVFYSFYGGLKSSDWRAATPTQSDGWFGNQMSVLPNGRIDISGINYCTSRNSGISWTCRRSIDSLFDGVVFFQDEQNGWVGGGTISPEQLGWVHRTQNGGQSWSGRILNAPFAIRNILFVDNLVGWAMGGNYFAGIGGIYGTVDGGAHWTLDLETPHEMVSCSQVGGGGGAAGRKIWCAGFGRNPVTNASESKIFVIEN